MPEPESMVLEPESMVLEPESMVLEPVSIVLPKDFTPKKEELNLLHPSQLTSQGELRNL